MIIFLYIVVLLFGTAVGSFLNVVADRGGRDETIRGRSYCEMCKKTLAWFELIPVLSFLFQHGKCRSCREPLSMKYPLVELFTGISFVLVFARIFTGLYDLNIFPISGNFSANIALVTTFTFVMTALLVVILVYDLKHKIIPNRFSYTFAGLALLELLFLQFFSPFPFLTFIAHLFAGPVLALPFVAIWYFSRGKGMGLGDAKLILGIGWLFGFSGGITALIIAFWSGALVGIGLLLYEKLKVRWGQHAFSRKGNELTMKSELPFAPFLIFGVALVFLFGMNFFFGTYQIFL